MPVRFGVVLLLYTGLNIYIGGKLAGFLKYFLPSLKGLVFWPLYFVFCFSFILSFLFRLDGLRALRQFGMYWQAVFVYLLLLFLAFDLVRLLLFAASRLGGKPLLSPRFNAAGVALVLCLTLGMMVYGTFHARNINTRHYEISLAKTGGKASLRIALISDLHIGATVDRKWVGRIVDAVNRESPDMVCIAGDIFDGDLDIVEDLSGVAAEFRRLKAPGGIYACLGNHDTDRRRPGAGGEAPTAADPFIRATGRIKAFLEEGRVTLLQDEVILTEERFYIAGRRDASPIGLRGAGRQSIEELIVSCDHSRPIILLDHQPVELREAAAAGIDLSFSGHTHQGQFFPGNLATYFIYKKYGTHYGYWQNGGLQAVVTSGIGVWGAPVRIATNSEVAVIDLRY
jgi:predicted MPP superfamily phosphohydrolase